ncbi:hypothetical protein [Ottowia sp.]|uniref:hypothetical protein n=1 Tax=Ottowia sp. TaxID=1898956 RepID=UPI0025FAD882|nr:hypothetical protein [Ottowia sp.]MBK6612630.1 hypothetical protein [Ottowia sp.]
MWDILSKEITGIQLLWEAVECLYFKAQGQGLAVLARDMPLFHRLTQTALMESLLMRMSRLMDPAATGQGRRAMDNLSLKRLAEVRVDTDSDVHGVHAIWEASGLKRIRDKYLSHNDLARSLNEPHTLNIPLDEADVAAMRELASGLREFRRRVHGRLHAGVAYLDAPLSLQVQREIDVLDRALQGDFLGSQP